MKNNISILIPELLQRGWTEVKDNLEYRKGNWIAFADTSSWWEIGTDDQPHVFDVAEPADPYYVRWTANLIEHLCKSADEIARLKKIGE